MFLPRAAVAMDTLEPSGRQPSSKISLDYPIVLALFTVRTKEVCYCLLLGNKIPSLHFIHYTGPGIQFGY